MKGSPTILCISHVRGKCWWKIGKYKMPIERTGIIRPYSNTLVELSRVLDVFLITAGLWLSTRWLDMEWSNMCTSLALLATLVFTIMASAYDMYRSWRLEPLRLEVKRILICWLGAVIVIVGRAYFFHDSINFSHELLGWWFLFTILALSGTRVFTRMALRLARISGYNFRRAAVVGATHTAEQLIEAIESSPWMGLRVCGIYDERNPRDKRVHPEFKELITGNIDDLIKAATQGEIDYVYVTMPLRAEIRIKDIIDRLSELPVSVLYTPDFFLFSMLRAQWQQVGHLHVINVIAPPSLGVSSITKRIEDIVLSTLILSVIAIPMLLVAISIRATSPGPVIFRQRRYGLNGKEFEIWKFRTMTVTEDGSSFVQAKRDDPRITRIGNFLRKTSLDELPQFINVLQGHMSIVGPRPHPVALDEHHRKLIPRYFFRHKILPGITGLAQIRGLRGETDTLDKMQMRIQCDIEYIDQWTLLLDLKIILLTLFRGFSHKNAY